MAFKVFVRGGKKEQYQPVVLPDGLATVQLRGDVAVTASAQTRSVVFGQGACVVESRDVVFDVMQTDSKGRPVLKKVTMAGEHSQLRLKGVGRKRGLPLEVMIQG